MKTQNQIYTTLAATLLLLLFAGQASAQSMMDTDLTDFLPVDDPYCTTSDEVDASNTSALSFASVTPCENVILTFSPGERNEKLRGVVDWVLIEVRDSASAPAPASSVVARKPAFLLNNGRVVDAQEFVDLTSGDSGTRTACLATTAFDADGCPRVSFSSDAFIPTRSSPSIEDSAYLVVYHRNHLAIQSANAVSPLTGNVGSYDFSANVADTLGGEGALTTNRGTDTDPAYAMFLGDANGDGRVNVGDAAFIAGSSSAPARIGQQYVNQDANMDSRANVGDAARVAGSRSSRNRINASFVRN